MLSWATQPYKHWRSGPGSFIKFWQSYTHMYPHSRKDVLQNRIITFNVIPFFFILYVGVVHGVMRFHGSEDNLWELGLSFLHMGLKTRVVRLGGKDLHRLSHLTSAWLIIIFKNVHIFILISVSFMCVHACWIGSQRRTWERGFSPSITWVLGTELRSLGSVANTSARWVIVRVLHDF